MLLRRFILCLVCLNVFVAVQGQQFQFVNLPFNDICYSVTNDRLYGVVGRNNPKGNAIFVINPANGNIEERIEVGSDPSHIRVSTDGRYLYVVLAGSPQLLRYDLLTKGFKPNTLLESKEPNSTIALHALDMELLPHSEGSVVISRLSNLQTPQLFDLVVFDSTQLRDRELFVQAGNRMVLADDGQTLWAWGYNNFSTAFKKLRINAQGIEELNSYPDLIKDEVTHVVYQSGRIYLQNGQIFDLSTPTAPQLLHTHYLGQDYNKNRAPQVPDLDSNYIYFTNDFDPNYYRDYVYRGSFFKIINKSTFEPIASIPIPGLSSLWSGANTKKIISLGKGRAALINQSFDKAGLMIYTPKPCQSSPVNLSIAPSQDLYACTGDTLELEATPGHAAYLWSSGQTGQKIQYARRGIEIDSVRVWALDSKGCWSKPSAPKALHFDSKPPEPKLGVRFAQYTICPGEKASLVAYVDDVSATSFIWSTGATTAPGKDYEVDSAGIYTVRARGKYGCLSDPKSIEILDAEPNAKITPTITANGPLSFCANQATIFSGPPAAFGYEWSNGASTQSIVPRFSGNLALRLLYPSGCKSRWSDTLQVKITNLPFDKLRIAQQRQELRIENAFAIVDSVQWSLNGQPIPNTNRSFFVPTEKGFYSVTNFRNGCASDPLAPFPFPAPVTIDFNVWPQGDQTSYLVSALVNPLELYRYKWNNGSADSKLIVDSVGTYCLTVYRDWTQDSTTACITFTSNADLEIQALDEGAPVQGMPIVLYRFLNPGFQVIDTLISTNGGRALFKGITPGVYYAQAIPSPATPLAKQYLPTYARSASLWGDANPFQLRGIRPENSPPEAQQILLQRTQMLMGEGSISGIVRGGEGFAPGNTQGFNAQNAGLANVGIVLYDANGKIVAVTYTDENGFYIFPAVPLGSYTVMVNLLGVPPVSQPLIVLADASTLGNINFMLKNGAFVIVGTQNIPLLEIELWPNPVSGRFYCKISEKSSISIYDAMGRIIAKRHYDPGVKEENVLLTQAAGLYWLKIQTESGKIGIKRLIKQ